MKIIDEKGRLFGKINIIDFFVIVFLLSLSPVFYFGYKISIKKPKPVESPAQVTAPVVAEEPKKEFFQHDFTFDFRELDPDILADISVGDKETDVNGEVIAEITWLSKPGPHIREFDIGKEQKVIKNYPILKRILATLRIKAEIRQNNLYYKENQIKYNSPVTFIINEREYTAYLVSPEKYPK